MGEKAGEAVHTYPLDFPLLREEISASKDLPSSSASYSNGFLFYLFVSSSCNCMPWRDSGLLEEIKQQLGLAAPMIAASLLQFLLQLISLMFAGHLGELALAGASMALLSPMLPASVYSLNTMWMVYMIPTGLGSAVSIRVSNKLGAGNSREACLSVRAVFVIVIIQGLLLALSTILVRDYWGYLFSYEEQVVRYVSVMMPILATSDFMDGVQCALSGAARGCGWQNICSIINLFAYYVVGMPSAILFAFFFHVGGKGLWLGIICALAIQVAVLIIINLRTDWDNEARKARDRLRSSSIVATAF